MVTAIGPDTELASGGGAAGDEVVASIVNGGYTTAITVPAPSVFAKPTTLTFAEAANLLLVGTTAADLLHASGAREGETVLLHGAAGAVGVSVLQQARRGPDQPAPAQQARPGQRALIPLGRRTQAGPTKLPQRGRELGDLRS